MTVPNKPVKQTCFGYVDHSRIEAYCSLYSFKYGNITQPVITAKNNDKKAYFACLIQKICLTLGRLNNDS